MPIGRTAAGFNPIDSHEPAGAIRFRRAKGWCEGCGRLHGRVVLHLDDGGWWDDEAGRWCDGAGRKLRLRPTLRMDQHGPPRRSTRVVLATCHRDHDPTDNDSANLAAFCQRCHIL